VLAALTLAGVLLVVLPWLAYPAAVVALARLAGRRRAADVLGAGA
jgi:hypothetical protein